MDFNLTWYKCFPHWPGPIPHRSRSHDTFKVKSTHVRVRAITYVCINGLPSNLVQMLSLLRQCAYIQEYLGYRSNNLYFLFSHSWPVVVYNFGQVERKTKCSIKKTTAGDIAVLKNDLFILLFLLFRYCTAVWVQSDVSDAKTVDRTSTVHDEVSKINNSKFCIGRHRYGY